MPEPLKIEVSDPVETGTEFTARFRLLNDLADTLTISQFKASCNCLKVTSDRDQLHPGESTVIEVRLRSPKTKGTVGYSVSVYSGEQPIATAVIKATVISLLEVPAIARLKVDGRSVEKLVCEVRSERIPESQLRALTYELLCDGIRQAEFVSPNLLHITFDPDRLPDSRNAQVSGRLLVRDSTKTYLEEEVQIRIASRFSTVPAKPVISLMEDDWKVRFIFSGGLIDKNSDIEVTTVSRGKVVDCKTEAKWLTDNAVLLRISGHAPVPEKVIIRPIKTSKDFPGYEINEWDLHAK